MSQHSPTQLTIICSNQELKVGLFLILIDKSVRVRDVLRIICIIAQGNPFTVILVTIIVKFTISTTLALKTVTHNSNARL